MTTIGVDVSHWQQPPLPWAAWVAGGLQVAGIKVTDGTAPEPHAAEHLAAATAARVPTLFAYHWLKPDKASQQYTYFIHAYALAYSFAALDVEQAGLTADDVLTWTRLYDAHDDGRPLVLYGNNMLALFMAAHPELRKYGVWYADYGAGGITSTPPFARPRAPSFMRVVGWQFAGNNGRLPPYTGAIDLTTWFELPSGTPPMTNTPLHGMHAQGNNDAIPVSQDYHNKGLAIGPLLGMELPGHCVDAKRIDPNRLTIARFSLKDRWEFGNDADIWSAGEIADYLATATAVIPQRAANEYDAVDVFIVGTNEWSPNGQDAQPKEGADWTQLGKIWVRLLEGMSDLSKRVYESTGRHAIRLGLPGSAQGTPEWHQLLELKAAGLWDAMEHYNALAVIHEGPFRNEDWQKGLGDVIPGAPSCPPGAGSQVGRVGYWYLAGLKSKFVIGEGYDGLTWHEPPSQRWPIMQGMDQHYRRHWPQWYAGICWFEVTSKDNPAWGHTDFTDTFRSAEMQDGIRQDNLTGENNMADITAARAAIAAAQAQLTAAVAALAEHVWKAGDVALAAVDPLPMYDSPGGKLVKSLHATWEIDIAAVDASGLWLRVTADWWCRAGDLRPK